jgi:mono/diheme cytochrome c family protein
MTRYQGPAILALTAVLALGAGMSLGASAQSDPKPAQEEWVAPIRASKKKNPIPADEKSVALGKAVYIRECLSCHGSTGKGDGPAAKDLIRKAGDLSSPKMWAQSDGALFWKISEGRTPMPTFEKLIKDENDRWHVINYVRTLAPKPDEKGTK